MMPAMAPRFASKMARTAASSLNGATIVCCVKLAGTPRLSGCPKVSAPEPAFTSIKTDARLTTQAARITHIDALYGLVQQHMRSQGTAYWLKELAARDIPVMPMMKLDDLLTDPHLAATGAWLDMDHPLEGRLRQLRPPVRMSDTPTGLFRPAPRLGEHTAEVLAELG